MILFPLQEAKASSEIENKTCSLRLDGTIARRMAVLTGRRINNQIEIVEGLERGHFGEVRVAVDGAGFLNDGDLVRVVDSPAGSQASGSAIDRNVDENLVDGSAQ